MSSDNLRADCGATDDLCAYALGAMTGAEASSLRLHVSSCERCRGDLDSLLPVVASFAAWPRDVLRPPPSVRERLASKISQETGRVFPAAEARTPPAPQWREVGPGISCKLLASDEERGVVSMLVRLSPGAAYPSHTHAGVEELHLLEGELWIDGRKLLPGDYNHAPTGTTDHEVYSETGCTCVLIANARDLLL